MRQFLNYVITGDQDRCPDCIVIYANPMDGSTSTQQCTLYRGQDSDDGLQFWQRALAIKNEMLEPMGPRARAVLRFRYGITAPAYAEAEDFRLNFLRGLHHTMLNDPSHMVRVNAACRLYDVLARAAI